MATGGYLITPTSVSTTGTGSSATITTNGSVTFGGTGVILNGVFTSSYENYTIVFRCGASGTDTLYALMRTGSTDVTGTGYAYQQVEASGTSIAGNRATSMGYVFVAQILPTHTGAVFNVYGPQLASPTVFRSMSTNAASTSINVFYDVAGIHNVSTSYESISLYSAANITMGGRVAVYGWNK